MQRSNSIHPISGLIFFIISKIAAPLRKSRSMEIGPATSSLFPSFLSYYCVTLRCAPPTRLNLYRDEICKVIRADWLEFLQSGTAALRILFLFQKEQRSNLRWFLVDNLSIVSSHLINSPQLDSVLLLLSRKSSLRRSGGRKNRADKSRWNDSKKRGGGIVC